MVGLPIDHSLVNQKHAKFQSFREKQCFGKQLPFWMTSNKKSDDSSTHLPRSSALPRFKFRCSDAFCGSGHGLSVASCRAAGWPSDTPKQGCTGM